MKIYVGTDLVEIKRFKRKLASSPSILRKLFSPREMQNTDPTHLAGIFAAKEAVIKALDLAPGSWLKIEVGSQKSGKPTLVLANNIGNKLESFDLSIAHDGNYITVTFAGFVK